MKKITISDIILLVLAALLCFGTKCAFHACPVGGEMIMSCHWAENAIVGVGAVLLAMAVIQLIGGGKGLRAGISISMMPMAVFAALIPNTIIRLCMKESMRCHSVMRPAVLIISILIIVFAVINLLLDRKQKS